MKIENPKSEIRNPKQIRNSKFEIRNEVKIHGLGFSVPNLGESVARTPTPALPLSTGRGGKRGTRPARGAAKRFGRARGFTLVEVLTAATLMAIVLPVAMYGVSVSLAASTMARRQAEAATLAEGKLEELAAAAM